MLNDSIGFRRKYFVKDLMDLNSFVNGASTVEFASFKDFAQVFLKDKKLSLSNAYKVIVPVETAEEAELVSLITPEALPFVIIYLKDFSKETRDKFTSFTKRALLIDADRTLELKTALLKEPSKAFLKFLQNTYGYFRGILTAADRERLTEIYTDPFFTFPYFCIADIRWDWESFEELKVSEFEAVQYFLNVLTVNMKNRKSTIDWKEFRKSEIIESSWTWDFMHVESPKRIYIKDGKMYINSPNNKGSEVDLYRPDLDGNDIPFKELDTLRHQYDVKFTDNCGIQNRFLISIEANAKLMGNAAMIPGSVYLVDHILTSGRV